MTAAAPGTTGEDQDHGNCGKPLKQGLRKHIPPPCVGIIEYL
jgi:hypothetical protein